MSDEAMIVDKTGSIFLAGSYLVKAAIGETIDIPASVQFLLDKEKVAIPMGASFSEFKAWMLANTRS
jgi:hypothetical protein